MALVKQICNCTTSLVCCFCWCHRYLVFSLSYFGDHHHLVEASMLLEHASTASKIKSADFSNCLVSLEQNVPGTQDLLHVIFLYNFVSGFSQQFCLP